MTRLVINTLAASKPARSLIKTSWIILCLGLPLTSSGSCWWRQNHNSACPQAFRMKCTGSFEHRLAQQIYVHLYSLDLSSLEPVARLSIKKRLNLALNPSASAPSSPPLSGQGNGLQGRSHVNGSVRGGTPPKQSQWDTGSSSRASWGSVRSVALTAPYETEFSVQERRQTLGQLDRKLDELTLEKRQIESALSRIPTAAGRATRQVRMDQEVLEERLDEVNRELGSVRMTLKRFHILRTSSHP
uniref:Uncharacterized protein n=1 Tax=Eptatretus burgeri TaxID=7764 RepID=A0A8C4Q8D4_EPTBU